MTHHSSNACVATCLLTFTVTTTTYSYFLYHTLITSLSISTILHSNWTNVHSLDIPMARHKFVASTRVSEEDPEDVPASVIRRPPKNRAGRASGFDHASADRRKDSESSLSSVPPDGSAADRRTRCEFDPVVPLSFHTNVCTMFYYSVPRATKEVVYKNPRTFNIHALSPSETE